MDQRFNLIKFLDTVLHEQTNAGRHFRRYRVAYAGRKVVQFRKSRQTEGVKGIIIHYVANPGSSAMANRTYWENLKHQSLINPKAVYASAHIIVGLQGEIIQTLPLDEMAYHCGAKAYNARAVSRLGQYPNNRAIGIELCHPDASGRFTLDTYVPAVDLAAELCVRFALKPERDIWRHYDITGKACPKWFVDKPDAFERFTLDVALAAEGGNG
jgi:N-acetylmuramoyl-L-alanine amidase